MTDRTARETSRATARDDTASHVLLLRHAEPSQRHRCHGARSDPGLSRRGQRQAADLALRVRLLADELGPVRRLLSSPSARAIATAVPLARDLARQHTVDERWRERDWGDWEGRPWDELWPTVPARVTHDADAYVAWTPPGGETPHEVDERVGPALQEALAEPGTTVVVTHAGPVRQALATALDLPLAATLRMDVQHARVVGLSRVGGADTLIRLGA